MPPTRQVIASVLLLLVAGCLGVPGADDPAYTSAGSPTPTGSPTSLGPDAVVVDFEDLPEETRPVVLTAIETGSVTTVAGKLEGLEPRETTHIRYNGTRYALSWRRGGYRAEYALNEVEPVNATTVQPGDDVAAYGDLSEDGQRLFDAALSGEPSGSYNSTAFPGELTHVDYVVFEGTHYRLLVVVADVPEVRLYAEPAGTESDGGSPTT